MIGIAGKKARREAQGIHVDLHRNVESGFIMKLVLQDVLRNDGDVIGIVEHGRPVDGCAQREVGHGLCYSIDQHGLAEIQPHLRLGRERLVLIHAEDGSALDVQQVVVDWTKIAVQNWSNEGNQLFEIRIDPKNFRLILAVQYGAVGWRFCRR